MISSTSKDIQHEIMNTSPLCLYDKAIAVHFTIIISCFSLHNGKINAPTIYWCDSNDFFPFLSHTSVHEIFHLSSERHKNEYKKKSLLHTKGFFVKPNCQTIDYIDLS